MTKKTYVPVRMPDDILVRVKKMAGDQGRSVSETVGMLVMKSLESGSNSGPEIDQVTIRKVIKEALKPLAEKMDILVPDWKVALSDIDLESARGLSVSENGPGLSLEIVRYLVETLARIESVLSSTTMDRPGGPGKQQEWGKIARAAAEKAVDELKMQRRA